MTPPRADRGAARRLPPSARALLLILVIGALHGAQDHGAARAGDAGAPPPRVEVRTIMCDRSGQLFRDDFDQTTPGGAWGGWTAGEWTSGGGVLRSAGKPGEHQPYREHKLPLKDLVIQVCVRFDGAGASWIGVGLDGGPAHHVLRCNIHPTSIDLQRWPGVGPDPTRDRIDSLAMPFTPGRWYTIVLELLGSELLATVDEKTVLYGSAPGIDCDKVSLTLLSDASGAATVSFAHLTLWGAKADPEWPKRREQVLQHLKKR